MKNVIKLFLPALFIVVVVTGTVVFSVSSLRNRFFGKFSLESFAKTKAVESPGKAGFHEQVKNEDVLLSDQVYALAQKLRKREEAVLEREKRVERMREALFEEQKNIDRLKDEVEKMHAEIARFFVWIEEGEKKNLKKIARMFETLSVENANPIIARMSDDTLVVVLSYMRPRNSAKLLGGYAALNAESADRAALLTEKLKKTVVR